MDYAEWKTLRIQSHISYFWSWFQVGNLHKVTIIRVNFYVYNIIFYDSLMILSGGCTMIYRLQEQILVVHKIQIQIQNFVIRIHSHTEKCLSVNPIHQVV